MKTALQLRQERYALVQEMGKHLDFSQPDNRTKHAELDAQQEALRVQIEAIERQEKIAAELAEIRNAERPPVGDGHEAADVRSTDGYKKGFDGFVRAGEQRADLSVSADGVLVPTGFQRELEVFLKAYSRIRDICRVVPTSTGNPLPWPRMDDTANSGSWLAEAAAMNKTSPTFDNVQLGAYLASSDAVLVSVQALQDFAFSPESFLTEAFGVRLGRLTNKAYTVGTGSGQPTGLLTALATDGTRNVTIVGANANSGNAGDTDINSLGSDDFDNLIAALDPAYRVGATFMANQSTYDAIRKTKDKYGRPLWQVSLAAGVPDSICGYPYEYNQDMDLLGANKKPIIFGNFKKYIVRDVLGISAIRFNELFMQNHQVGFAAFMRTDGKLLQAKAFAVGVCPAT